MTKTVVKLRTNGMQFTYKNSKYLLLEALELHAVKVECQCRSGYCGSCRLKLVEGEVIYYQTPLALINHGEILPCCCIPLTDIELDI